MSTEAIAALTGFCVDNPELDQLEAMLAEFNLFEAAGLTNQEIRHSRFLSFLLDPKGAHGLGELFATRLLQAAVHGHPPKSVAKPFFDGMLEEMGWIKTGMYRYPPNLLDVVPAGPDDNPIVLFWVDYALKPLSLVMEIQPGTVEVRQKLFDAAVANPAIFSPARKALGNKYNRILRVDIAPSSTPAEGDIEEWELQVREGFARFCEEILPRAALVLREAVSGP